jgi:DNA-binding CsgD family transcriptional regulator
VASADDVPVQRGRLSTDDSAIQHLLNLKAKHRAPLQTMPTCASGSSWEEPKLFRLIGDIYDAALDRARWGDALGKAARFIGGPSAALYSKNVNGEHSALDCFCGFDPEFVHSYCDGYFRMDPANGSHFLAPVGQPIATATVMPYAEFLKTRYYREWKKPQHLVDCLNVVLDRSEAGIVLFGVSRHADSGVADEAARHRMCLVAPHIRRAVLIARQLDRRASEAEVLADSLDSIGAGIFLLGRHGHLIHANAAGNRLLEAEDCLTTVCGRLTPNDLQADCILQRFFAGAGDGELALGINNFAMSFIARDGTRYMAHGLPLTAGTRRNVGKAFAATAALIVHRASMSKPSVPEVIAEAYRLTPTELRVLLAIVEVGGAPEVADALGVSAETVKKHLAHVYDKTGTRRQADLVKLAAGFSNPLAG